MPHPKVSFLYFMETSSSYGLLDIFKFCLFHIKRYFIEHTQFEQKQMIRGKHMAAVQQMVQLVNYFLHHHQPALERAFQKYISSHWTNQLELVFQVFASSPSFNSTSACNPVYWLHDSSVRLLSKASQSVCTSTVTARNLLANNFEQNQCSKEIQYCCKLSFKPYEKNDAEYTSSYVLNTWLFRLYQKADVENGWDVVTGSRGLPVCLSRSQVGFCQKKNCSTYVKFSIFSLCLFTVIFGFTFLLVSYFYCQV